MVANVSGQTVTGMLRHPSRVNPNGYELSVFAGARDLYEISSLFVTTVIVDMAIESLRRTVRNA